MQYIPMRTTVTLSEETHAYATYYAQACGITLGAALDELIEKAREASSSPAEIQFLPNGLPVFLSTGRTITPEEVRRLEGEEFEPE